jgi:hypothetical protein
MDKKGKKVKSDAPTEMDMTAHTGILSGDD